MVDYCGKSRPNRWLAVAVWHLKGTCGRERPLITLEGVWISPAISPRNRHTRSSSTIAVLEELRLAFPGCSVLVVIKVSKHLKTLENVVVEEQRAMGEGHVQRVFLSLLACFRIACPLGNRFLVTL